MTARGHVNASLPIVHELARRREHVVYYDGAVPTPIPTPEPTVTPTPTPPPSVDEPPPAPDDEDGASAPSDLGGRTSAINGRHVGVPVTDGRHDRSQTR